MRSELRGGEDARAVCVLCVEWEGNTEDESEGEDEDGQEARKIRQRYVGYRRFNRALGAMMSTMGRVLTFLL